MVEPSMEYIKAKRFFFIIPFSYIQDIKHIPSFMKFEEG
jgi:hypothetical protein